MPGVMQANGVQGRPLLLASAATSIRSDHSATKAQGESQKAAARKLYSWAEAGTDVGQRKAVVVLLQWQGMEHPSGDAYAEYKAKINRHVQEAADYLYEWSHGKLSLSVEIVDPVTLSDVPPDNGYRAASESYLASQTGREANLFANFDFVLWWLPGGFMEAGEVGVMIGQQTWYHGTYPVVFGRTVVAHVRAISNSDLRIIDSGFVAASMLSPLTPPLLPITRRS